MVTNSATFQKLASFAKAQGARAVTMGMEVDDLRVLLRQMLEAADTTLEEHFRPAMSTVDARSCPPSLALPNNLHNLAPR